jgi:hypothetical protein
MKCQEYRFHFDGVIVDVKLSFHRICTGRFADSGGGVNLKGISATESDKANNNGGSHNTIQKWASGFRRSTICRFIFDG